VVLAIVCGCSKQGEPEEGSEGKTSPSPLPDEKKTRPEAKSPVPTEKPYVEVTLSEENYKKALPHLKTGTRAKFKGDLSLNTTRGNRVHVRLAEYYTGDKKAFNSVNLTWDFKKSRSAALKKYVPKGGYWTEIIVEGVITELHPEDYSVRLVGYEG
jgi:hypothetical protein